MIASASTALSSSPVTPEKFFESARAAFARAQANAGKTSEHFFPSAEIDWARLVTYARQHHLTLTARAALDYLARTFDAPIPAEVLRELFAIPIARAERWDYAAKMIAPTERGARLTTWAYLREYRRAVMNENFPRQITAFPKFMLDFWHLDHLWQVPVYAVTGATRRIARSLRRALGRGTL